MLYMHYQCQYAVFISIQNLITFLEYRKKFLFYFWVSVINLKRICIEIYLLCWSDVVTNFGSSSTLISVDGNEQLNLKSVMEKSIIMVSTLLGKTVNSVIP